MNVTSVQPVQPAPDHPLRRASQELETAFLAEMLRAAGLGSGASAFGGGPGEEHFRSFLIDEQARGMVAAGGIGLTESLFSALSGRPDDR